MGSAAAPLRNFYFAAAHFTDQQRCVATCITARSANQFRVKNLAWKLKKISLDDAYATELFERKVVKIVDGTNKNIVVKRPKAARICFDRFRTKRHRIFYDKINAQFFKYIRLVELLNLAAEIIEQHFRLLASFFAKDDRNISAPANFSVDI